MTFQEYWETDGSRKQVESHEERARLAWEAAKKDKYHEYGSNAGLCGMSYKIPETWENEGGR